MSEKKTGNEKRISGKKNKEKPAKANRTMLRTLEPRMVFDGAMAATVEAAHQAVQHAEPQHAVASASFPELQALLQQHFSENRPVAESLPSTVSSSGIDHQIVSPNAVQLQNDASRVIEPINSDKRPAPECLLAAAPEPVIQISKEIVFIDPSVGDVATLVRDAGSARQVIILDPTKDGVDQIAAVLSHMNGVTGVHILSHGSEANLYLGTADLNSASMTTTYASDLAIIKASLAPNANILVYGCDFALGTDGDAAAHKLAELTGASVAASTDLTGSAARGGDWVLEDRIGAITVKTIEATDFDGVLVKANTGAFTIVGNVATNTTNGVTTTITFTNAAGATGTNPGAFTGPTTGTLANIAGIYDNSAQNAADVSTVFNSTGGTQVGTVTITFSKPVNNPEINLDRIGGTSGTGTSNSSIWTLTSGQTLTKILGTASLLVTSTTFERQVNVTTTGSATSTNTATGTAGGTVMVNGVSITSITFNVTMDQANTNTIGDGFGLALTVDASPTAVNDTFTTPHDTPVTISVLSNDTSPTNDPLTVTQVNGAAIIAGGASVSVTGGSVALNATGQLIFTPSANTVGTPSFT